MLIIINFVILKFKAFVMQNKYRKTLSHYLNIISRLLSGRFEKSSTKQITFQHFNLKLIFVCIIAKEYLI